MSIALEATLAAARVALAAAVAVAAAAVASFELWTASASATGGKDDTVPFGIAVALTNAGLHSIW